MKQQPFNAWIDCVKNDQAGMLATILNGSEIIHKGSRLFVSENGDKRGSLGDIILDEKIVKLGTERLRQMVPESKTHIFDIKGKSISVFLDVHIPSPKVMIFGAGHDAIPVASFARQSGFDVTVIDQREAFAREELFPGAKIILARPEYLADKVYPDKRTLIIIMNHHLDKDRDCLHFSLESEAPYVGLLGPRKRCNRLLRELESKGIKFSREALSRLYNPVGLDIGAEGSDEIAISIVSEMIAFKNKKNGKSLREQYITDETYKLAE